MGYNNVIKVLNGLLRNTDGVLQASTKQQILAGVNKAKESLLMLYPKCLLEHKVTYEVFPEIWDLVVDTLVAQSDDIVVKQKLIVILELDALDHPD